MAVSRFVKFVFKDGTKRAINTANVIHVSQSVGVIRIKYNAPSGGGSFFVGSGFIGSDPYSEEIIFTNAAEADHLYNDLTNELK